MYFSRNWSSAISRDYYFHGVFDFQGSYVDVSENSGTPKSSHFNTVWHYKSSSLGGFTPIFGKQPCFQSTTFRLQQFQPKEVIGVEHRGVESKGRDFLVSKNTVVDGSETLYIPTQDGWNPVNRGILTIYHINWWVDPGFLSHQPYYTPQSLTLRPWKPWWLERRSGFLMGIRWSLFRGAKLLNFGGG